MYGGHSPTAEPTYLPVIPLNADGFEHLHGCRICHSPAGGIIDIVQVITNQLIGYRIFVQCLIIRYKA